MRVFNFSFLNFMISIMTNGKLPLRPSVSLTTINCRFTHDAKNNNNTKTKNKTKQDTQHTTRTTKRRNTDMHEIWCHNKIFPPFMSHNCSTL